MKTNDIKKGMNILLKNGWYATIADNRKGNIRTAEVRGYVTEVGSIYSADIEMVEMPGGGWEKVEHSEKQKVAAGWDSFF